MVKRNADGSLRTLPEMPDDGWLKEDTSDLVDALLAARVEKGRQLTEEERAEIVKDYYRKKLS